MEANNLFSTPDAHKENGRSIVDYSLLIQPDNGNEPQHKRRGEIPGAFSGPFRPLIPAAFRPPIPVESGR
jgi:hypothetical protein